MAALLLGACWSWSFPDNLLTADGGTSDGGTDALATPDATSGGTGGGMGGGGGGSSPGGAGGGPSGGSGGSSNPGACLPTSCVAAATPVCDAVSRVCRPCRKDNECATSGLCALDGHCATDDQIAFVSPTCPATPTGTRAAPFCTIADALVTTKPYVFVSGGVHNDVRLSAPRELHGTPGTVIHGGMRCQALLVDGPGVAVMGFTVDAGVVVTGKDASLQLINNQIGPSNCVGVTASSGAGLVMERNFIYANADGGVWVDDVPLQMKNNVIAGNGGAMRNFGGARLAPRQPSLVVNNTIVNNRSRGNMVEAPGLRCDATLAVANNIVWGNVRGQGVGQMSPECVSTFGLVQLAPGEPGTANNIASDPQFTGGPPNLSASYRLNAASPAINPPSTLNAPALDFDAEPRDAKPDLGSFEHR